MKSLFIIFTICLTLLSCKEKTNEIGVVSNQQSDLEVYNFNDFEVFLNQKDDKVYVINFWATWCAPCIKELPHFEAINESYKDQNVEVILVSLDFPNQYEKKLIPFVKKRQLKSRVIALNDTKMNDWIPKVSDAWSGAIPATIIYNKNMRKFYERTFTQEELETELKLFTTL